ncbi:MAG: ABC transporter permease [Clostridia bacterium]|nr:ABC transporter permease [Clostridia bacterium]
MTKVHEPLFHLTKRTTGGSKRAWALRATAFLISVLVCAIVSVALTEKNMGYFFEKFFNGVFGTSRNAWNLFHETAILLLIALAVTPCFKMRFWNIGGEGQVLMAGLGAAVAINFMGGKVADIGTIIVSLILAIAFGVVWAVIPALFKAKWNTNETLLTLMMNYIAVCLVEFFIKSVASSGTGTLTFKYGVVQAIGGNEFILKIIVVAVLTTLVAVYMKFSKHGYEIAVVGESPNTAKYVGINTKVVIVRTLVLCGALCGIAGFLLVSATNHSLSSSSTVGGRGFTGVLISWLGQFNPIFMAINSLLVVFIERGAKAFGNYAGLGASYPNVMTGIFFFFIIAVEFFVNYKFVFREDIQTKIDGFNRNVKLKLSKKKATSTATQEVASNESNEAQEEQTETQNDEEQLEQEELPVQNSDSEQESVVAKEGK